MCIKSMDQENKFVQLLYLNWFLNIFKVVDLFKMDQEKFNVFLLLFVLICIQILYNDIVNYVCCEINLFNNII